MSAAKNAGAGEPGGAAQLVLPLGQTPQMSRADFVTGAANREALQLLGLWPVWPAPVLLLEGDAGTGKTHLARIHAAESGAYTLGSQDLAGRDPVALARRALVLENADAGTVHLDDLFHLVNAVRSAGSTLLITARRPATEWAAPLPDLLSRLRAAVTVRLGPPDDALLAQVLVKLFADRQTAVDPAVVAYIVARMERSFAAAGEIVAAIDGLAMARGTAPGRAIAADVLARFAGPGPQIP